MVPGPPQVSRFLRRAERARLLAGRHPEAAESLLLFAKVSEAQHAGADRAGLEQLTAGLTVPLEWFDRVMAETEPATPPPSRQDNECPACGAPPQLGVLRPQGDGAALYLACAVCRAEWLFPRSTCPACGDPEHLAFYSAETFPAIRVQTCGACRTYFHLIDAHREPAAVPEADEIAAQPLDVWAIGQGFTKLTPNLVGL